MDSENTFDLTKLLGIFYRRKDLILAVFLVGSTIAAYLASTLPDMYRSSTLILINRQKIPSRYIDSAVTVSVRELIKTMVYEVLGRTSLKQIVKEFHLYSSQETGSRRGAVGRLRKDIRIEIDPDDRKNSFQLAYESQNPQKAQQVTARLSSIFIDETLELREQRAAGTTAFIRSETDRLRKDLEAQEARVNQYKVKNQYELPTQLQANLNRLERLRNELQSNQLRLSAFEERKATLSKQLLEAEQNHQGGIASLRAAGESLPPQLERLEKMKTELTFLLTRYSEKHPDVIRLKHGMEAAEAEGLAALAGKPGTQDVSFSAEQRVSDPMQRMLLKQIADVNAEIQSVEATNQLLRDKIAVYQTRVDNTPARSLELSKITRTYDTTVNKFQDLMGKLLESQVSENMEKEQKADLFQIVEPANLPGSPYRPDRRRILIVGLVLGLGVGCGLAFLLENLNTSFRSSDELNSQIDLPVLASIPAVRTGSLILAKRREQVMLFLASTAVLVVGIVAARFYAEMYY